MQNRLKRPVHEFPGLLGLFGAVEIDAAHAGPVKFSIGESDMRIIPNRVAPRE